MDRRTEKQLEGYADSCLGCIFGGIIGLIILSIKTLIGLVIGLFVKTGEKNPEDELRKYRNTLYKRQQIEGIVCPKCETKNEEHQTHCYMCGSAMVKQVRKTNSSNNTIQIAAGVAVILVVAVIVFSSKWEFSQTVNVQASNQNKQLVVNSPTATSSSDEMKAVVRGYLNAVADGKCNSAMTYLGETNHIYKVRCENGYFQVLKTSSVSRVRKLDSSTTLFLARGKFKMGDNEYNTLHFEIVEGKIHEFPQPQGTPTPLVTPTLTPEPQIIQELRVLLTKYYEARKQGDCDQAWSYVFEGQPVNRETAWWQMCKGDGLLMSYRIDTITLTNVEQNPNLSITGEFTFKNKETVTWGDYWLYRASLKDVSQGVRLRGCSGGTWNNVCLPKGGL